jgi:putative CocE/NonD family hydrolase
LANSGVGIYDLMAASDTRTFYTNYDQVNFPFFIVQGTNDGLFSQNQAVDAYLALRRRHVPARLYVGGIGHPPSDGSLDSPEAKHVEAEVLAWFDHYLKGVDNGIDKMPPIEYSRADYFGNRWDGTTRSAWKYPFGKPKTFALCTTGPGGGTLSTAACPGALPAVAVNNYAGAGWDQEPVTANGANDLKNGLSTALGQPFPDTRDAPPTLVYNSAPLGAPLDMAGIPRLDLQVVAADSLPAGVVPSGTTAAFQLDPKFYDVAPDGSAKLLTRGAFSEPLDGAPGAVGPHDVAFDAFGLSNLVPAGHRLRLTLQTSDAPYLRPSTNPFAVGLLAGSEVELPAATKMFATPALGSASPPFGHAK